MGNIRILPATAAEGLTYWEDFAAYYDAAEALPYGGFIFDASELETEQAALAPAIVYALRMAERGGVGSTYPFLLRF